MREQIEAILKDYQEALKNIPGYDYQSEALELQRFLYRNFDELKKLYLIYYSQQTSEQIDSVGVWLFTHKIDIIDYFKEDPFL